MSKKEKTIPSTIDALQEMPATALTPASDNATKQSIESLEFEKLKLLYENVSEQNRFYLSWRHKLVAGHFAVLAVLFYAIYELKTSEKGLDVYAGWPAFGITLVSVLIMGFDFRNQKLFKSAQIVGAAIEQKLGMKMPYHGKEMIEGFFLRHEKTIEGGFMNKYFTHTNLIWLFYIICMVLGVWLSRIL